jgi:hypothetical protein
MGRQLRCSARWLTDKVLRRAAAVPGLGGGTHLAARPARWIAGRALVRADAAAAHRLLVHAYCSHAGGVAGFTLERRSSGSEIVPGRRAAPPLKEQSLTSQRLRPSTILGRGACTVFNKREVPSGLGERVVDRQQPSRS